jgi:hypothetical protein
MDISMCENKTCKKRESCYRFTAKPSSHWQSYGTFKPDETGNCNFFQDNDENKTIKNDAKAKT